MENKDFEVKKYSPIVEALWGFVVLGMSGSLFLIGG